MANSVNEAEEQKVGVGRYDLNESQKRVVKEFTPLPPIGGEAIDDSLQPKVVTHQLDSSFLDRDGRFLGPV